VTQRWSSRVRGPLAVHAAGFRQHLLEQGYAPAPVSLHLGLLTDLSGWLEERGLDVDAIDAELVVTFTAERRRRTRFLSSPRGLRPLLGYLDTLSLLPMPVPAVGTVDVLLVDYRRYLLEVRSLAATTMPGYMKTARRFAAECLRDTDGGLAEITAGDVAAFITRAGAGYRPKTVNEIVVGLRSLLRFMYATGRIDRPLWETALGMAGWHGGPLPGRLPRGAGEAILASCDRSRLVGSRDFAMIILASVSACGLGKSPRSSSMTCDGEAESWSCEAKVEDATHSPCPSMSAKPSPTTYASEGRAVGKIVGRFFTSKPPGWG
jgi:hypothetical protein